MFCRRQNHMIREKLAFVNNMHVVKSAFSAVSSHERIQFQRPEEVLGTVGLRLGYILPPSGKR